MRDPEGTWAGEGSVIFEDWGLPVLPPHSAWAPGCPWRVAVWRAVCEGIWARHTTGSSLDCTGPQCVHTYHSEHISTRTSHLETECFSDSHLCEFQGDPGSWGRTEAISPAMRSYTVTLWCWGNNKGSRDT